MIKSALLKDKGVLIVSPEGPLAASDFERLAAEIDPYIEQNGRLYGLMVHTESFPGWADFAALLSHLKFAKDHKSKIEKVASVSDSGFLRIIPSVASHFVKTKVKHFDYDDRDKALEWLVIGATTHRLRPIVLTAAAASLGMIPIAPEVFWGPMAYAIIRGLFVATLLTLLFLPTLYVAWFRVKEPRKEREPGLGVGAPAVAEWRLGSPHHRSRRRY